MQVVRSGLWTRRSVSIGVGSVSMGALRERLNDERGARERFGCTLAITRFSLGENPGHTPACPKAVGDVVGELDGALDGAVGAVVGAEVGISRP